MLRILVIDDSRSVHAFVKQCLATTGCSIESAFDGIEGLSRLKELVGRVDLVLLDWEMPKLIGPDTFTEIRKAGIELPVVMMTTRNAMDDIMKMLQAGVSEYVMKPFTKDILIGKIEMVTGRQLKDVA